MKILFSLPLVLLFILGMLKGPTHPDLSYADAAPPLVLETSLADTLPSHFVKAMRLHHVTGIKIQYITGFYASYFEYEADQNELLKSISKLPFYIGDGIADTECNPLAMLDLELIKQKIPAEELKITTDFWNANDQADLEVYQCVKPPFKHTILTHKNSNRILHRIEFFG